MLHLLHRDPTFFRVANCGMCATLRSGRDGKGKFHKPARSLVEGAGVVTRIGQRREALPHLRMGLPDLIG
jgi:hypothetical protein